MTAKYHGGGFGGALAHVPARDLADEEWAAACELYAAEELDKLYDAPKGRKTAATLRAARGEAATKKNEVEDEHS